MYSIDRIYSSFVKGVWWCSSLVCSFTSSDDMSEKPPNLPLVASKQPDTGEVFGMAFVSFLFISISPGVFLRLILRDWKYSLVHISLLESLTNHWMIVNHSWSTRIFYWLIIGHHGWSSTQNDAEVGFHAVCMIGFKPNQLQITVGEAKATTFSQKPGTVHRNFHGCIKRHCPFWDACAF